jgi:23S rRNA pseudouridine2604 synthase
MSDKIRLSKLLSERGICSRREADNFIAKGWVKVNGETVSELGTRVDRDAQVELSSLARKDLNEKVTILLNKPVGYVSQNPEKGYVPAIRLIQPANQWKKDGPLKPSHFEGLAVAGRLDIDSKGLLIFTQDGALAKRIIGENSEIEKEYLVWVDQDLNPTHLEKLRAPMQLDGKKLKPMGIEQLAPQKLRMVLKEGKKRQIRRVCEAVGLRVTSLQRVRVGRLRLGPLPEGQWRFLKENESV